MALEGAAALALAVNVVNVVKYGWKVFERFEQMRKSVGETPQVFRDLEATLPLLLSALEQHRKRVQHSNSSGAADAEAQALSRVCDGCTLQISLLEKLIDGCIPRADDGSVERAKLVFLSFRNEANARKISASLETYLRALSYHIALSEPTTTSRDRDETPGQFWVPFERDPGFVGRADLLADMDEAFKRTNTVSLSGIGGVGKTQIAIEYCRRSRDENPRTHVIWTFCHTMGRFQQSCSKMAAKLGLSNYGDVALDYRLMIKDYFEKLGTRPWLMILDNLDDIEMVVAPESDDQAQERCKISAFIPTSEHGRILITTRDKRIGLRLSGKMGCLNVDPLDEDTARQLLQGRLIATTAQNDYALHKICHSLGNLPLALSQAAAYMNQYFKTPEDYVQLMTDSDLGMLQLLNEDLGDRRRDLLGSNAIGRTWEVTFRRMLQQDRLAADMLALMSTLEPQNIPIQMMSHLEPDRLKCTKALGTLQALSLVHSYQLPDGNTMFSMHRLVQRFTRKWLSSDGSYEQHREIALAIMSSQDFETTENLHSHRILLLQEYQPTAKTMQSYGTMFKLILEAETRRTSGSATLQICSSIFARVKGEMILVYPDYQQLVQNLAALCYSQGLYEDCVSMLQPLVETHLNNPFENSEDIKAASSLCFILALAFAAKGNENGATTIYSRLLGKANDLLKTKPEVSKDILIIKYNMMEMLNSIGDDLACLNLCKEIAPTMALQNEEWRGKYYIIRGAQNRKGGKRDEAETDLLAGLRMMRNASMSVPNVLARLAATYALVRVQVRLGKLDEARRHAQETIRAADDMFPDDDPRKAVGIYLLAELHQMDGRLDDAQSLIENLVDTMACTQFSLTKIYAFAFELLADIQFEKGNHSASLALTRKRIDANVQSFGASDVYTLLSKHNYGSFLHEAGEMDSAMAVWQEVVLDFNFAACRAIWITDTLFGLSLIAFEHYGRIDDAIDFAYKCLQETSIRHGRDSDEYQDNMWQYARYLSKRDMPRAISVLRNECELFKSSNTDNGKWADACQLKLGRLLYDDEQYAECESIERQALNKSLQTTGSYNLTVMTIAWNLACTTYREGRILEAYNLLKQCQTTGKELLKPGDPNHGDLVRIEQDLATLNEEVVRQKKLPRQVKSKLTKFQIFFKRRPHSQSDIELVEYNC